MPPLIKRKKKRQRGHNTWTSPPKIFALFTIEYIPSRKSKPIKKGITETNKIESERERSC